MSSPRAAGRAAFALATAAVVFAAAFTVWALTAGAYSSAGQTLVEANDELTVRLAIAAPLAVTTAVWLLLHAACRRNLASARSTELWIAWLLVAFSIISGFSIGLFVMPAALLLAAAAHFTPVTART